MYIIFVNNPIKNEIYDNFFNSNSWSIRPFYDGNNIENIVNYSQLSYYGKRILDEDCVIGYDIKKKIYLSFGKNTFMEEYIVDIEGVEKNKIYEKTDYVNLINKIPEHFIDKLSIFDFVLIQ